MINFCSKSSNEPLLAKSKLYGIAAVGAFVVGVCIPNFVYGHAVVETGQFIASDIFYRVIDKDLAKVTFDKDSSDLSKDSFATLADFVNTTKNESRVDRYIVATWSDQDSPAKGELSKNERKLATMRSENIKKGLSAAGAKNIDTYEMTEQPNWMQRAFSTPTADINNKGRSNTANERMLKEIGQKLREQGGPRTAVIVAKFKNEVLSE
jgi:hypothetical protein